MAGNTDPVASCINANFPTGTVTNTTIVGGCGRFGLTDNGGNLDDGTSGDLSAATSKSNATLTLVALANNGGPTQTDRAAAQSMR